MGAKQILRDCPHCEGKGTVLLTGVYLDTLAVLKRCREPISGVALAAKMHVKNPAMCNRLRVLAAHGLAASQRFGRVVLWEAT